MKISITSHGVYTLEYVVVHSRVLKENITLKLKGKTKKDAREALENAAYSGYYNPAWAASTRSPNWKVTTLGYLARPKFRGDDDRERRELSYENFRQMDLKPEDQIFFRTTVEAKKFPET
ncbi:MAG: hypothetical protein AABW82_01305 [Nanoarchaeota archaeon]